MLQKSSSEPVVLFADPPSIEELCAITVTVNQQCSFSQVASTFQPQILKCREVIYTEPDVLATPAFDVENCFHIVMQQSVYKTGKLQSRFRNIGLEPSKPFRVTPALYQSCLRYTLMAKIAPNWNKAGEWFIQGRDFLTHTGYSSAVKMNLLVNKDELLVSLLATSVKFPPMQLMDLDIDHHVLHQLTSGHPNMMRDMTPHNCWCHILPSMKRGRICSVSTFVPPDGPFTSYRDLKRHWKNTYGYRLPDTDEDIVYYQISFRQNGGKLFTYPSICLRAMHMQQIPRIDPKPILISFIKDIHSKLPSVCGHTLRFLPKVRYAIPELYDSAMKSNGQAPNLSTKNPTPSSVPLRNIKDLSHMYNPRPSAPMSIPSVHHQSEIPESQKLSTSFQSYSNEISQAPACMPAPSDRTYNSSSGEASMAVHASNRATLQPSNNSATDSFHGSHYVPDRNLDAVPQSQSSDCVSSRLVPVFRAKSFKSATISRDVKATRTVPVFKPKSKIPFTATQSSSNNKHCESSLPSAERPRPNWESMQSSCEKITGPIGSAPCFAKKPTFSKSLHQPAAHKRQDFQHGPSPQMSRKSQSLGHVQGPGKMLIGGSIQNTIGSGAFNRDCNRPLPSPSMSDSVRVSSLSSKQGSESLKRKANMDNTDCSVKKPRAKPQVQDVDVEMLAKANQLGKVNSVTLLNWLRSRGALCKAKDKKADLVQQVNHILQLHTAEV